MGGVVRTRCGVAGHAIVPSPSPSPISLVTDGQLTIDFDTITGNAKVSAIGIQSVEGP
jgi:hypothetical protein